MPRAKHIDDNILSSVYYHFLRRPKWAGESTEYVKIDFKLDTYQVSIKPEPLLEPLDILTITPSVPHMPEEELDMILYVYEMPNRRLACLKAAFSEKHNLIVYTNIAYKDKLHG